MPLGHHSLITCRGVIPCLTQIFYFLSSEWIELFGSLCLLEASASTHSGNFCSNSLNIHTYIHTYCVCVCSYQLVSFHKTSSYILKTSPFHSLSPIPISPLKHLTTWLHGCRQPSNSSTSKTKFKKCVYNDHCTKIFREILFVTAQTQNGPYTHE